MPARAEPPAEPVDALDLRPYVPPPVAVVALFAIVLGLAGSFWVRAVGRAEIGETRIAEALLNVERRDIPAVPFRLKRLGGGEMGLSDLAGKKVFLNFWATWCPPCLEELPSMRRLAERLRARPDLVMVAVSTDDTLAPVEKLFAGKDPGLVVLHDPSGELARQYGTTRFPETYLLVDGQVRGFIEGPRDWDQWFAEAYLSGVLDHGLP